MTRECGERTRDDIFKRNMTLYQYRSRSSFWLLCVHVRVRVCVFVCLCVYVFVWVWVCVCVPTCSYNYKDLRRKASTLGGCIAARRAPATTPLCPCDRRQCYSAKLITTDTRLISGSAGTSVRHMKQFQRLYQTCRRRATLIVQDVLCNDGEAVISDHFHDGVNRICGKHHQTQVSVAFDTSVLN
jgi:hypothetical protein